VSTQLAAARTRSGAAGRRFAELGIGLVGSGPLAVPRRLPVRALSAGSLARFERCPAQWRAHYIERCREPANVRMISGSAIGNTLAAYFERRIAGEAEMSAADADDRLLAEFELEAETIGEGGGEGEKPESAREGLRPLLRSYLSEVAPNLRPVAIEREVRFAFSGAEWSFVGYLDLETEGGGCVDYKCSTKHLAPERAKTDTQPTSYLLAKALEGCERPSFDYHSLRRGKVRDEADRIRIVPAPRTEVQLELFKRRIAAVARQIALADALGEWAFSTQGWWCGATSCANWARCPAGGLG
jgi:hypothetical protein